MRLAVHLAHERRVDVYSGTSRVDNLLGEDTAITTMTPELSLGLGRGFGLTVAIPFVRMHYQILRHQNMDGEPLPRFDEVQTGIGDIPLMFQWGGSPPESEDLVLWVGAGVTVPAGMERDYPALRDMNFGEVLTLSSGTFDPLFTHGLSLTESSRRWTSAVFGRWTPYANQFGYRSGSVLSWSLGLQQDIFETQMSAVFLMGYRHQWRAQRNGQDVLNSGGDWVTFTPGIKWTLSDTVNVSATVELPVWRRLYAGPDDIEQLVNGQTDANQRWLLSVRYSLGG